MRRISNFVSCMLLIAVLLLPACTDSVAAIPSLTPDTQPVVPAPMAVPAEPRFPHVLMYHLVRDQIYGNYPYLFVRPNDFSMQLAILNDAGIEYRFADDYSETDHDSVILTFDDGYVCNYEQAFPLLKAYDAKATIFLVTDLIGVDNHLTAAQITEMYESGLVRFGLHTASHADLRLLDEAGIRDELERGIAAFEAVLGFKPTVLAYPYGGYNDTVRRICAEYFTAAYTTDYPPNFATDQLIAIPRFTVERDQSFDDFRDMMGLAKP